jgi:hypothetical protein
MSHLFICSNLVLVVIGIQPPPICVAVVQSWNRSHIKLWSTKSLANVLLFPTDLLRGVLRDLNTVKEPKVLILITNLDFSFIISLIPNQGLWGLILLGT